ncbi:MAG: hypothetical protein WB586_26895 [Chthoniobacterales bacterium]
MIRNKDGSIVQLSGSRQPSGALLFERFRGFPLLTTLILALPSLYFVTFVPPLWRDSDGFVQIAMRLNFINVIHFPPLYCLGSRVPLFIGSLLDSTALSRGFRGISMDPPILTNLGIFLLVSVQHLLLIGALLITCVTITGRKEIRWAIAAFFALNPALYAFANCVGSEAFSNVLVLLVAVLGLRFVLEPKTHQLRLLFLALVAAILTRHVNGILCGLLPGTLILLTALRIFPSTDSVYRPGLSAFPLPKLLQTLGLVILVGVAAIGTAKATVWLICRVKKIPDVSRLGYTFQWRLDYLTRVDPVVRKATLARISTQLHDPATTYAIQRFEENLNSKKPWDPEILSRILYERLESDETLRDGKERRVAVDHRLNRLAQAVLLSGGQDLYNAISEDFRISLMFAPGRICGEPFYGTDWLIGRANQDVFAPLRSLSTFQLPAGTFVQRWLKDPYLCLWSKVPLWSLALLVMIEVLIGLTWGSLRRSQLPLLLHAMAAVATGAVMLLANCSLTFRAPRFALSTYILFLFAFILATTKLCEAFRFLPWRTWASLCVRSK